MEGKKSSAITDITLNDIATFHNVHIDPTYINFFYGKNGAGKSTIAKAINDRNATALTFQNGEKHKDDYNILLYDQDFVRNNIKDDAELPGVFTIKESDIKKKEDIDKKIKELDALDESNKKLSDDIKTCQSNKNKLTEDFQDTCFSVTKDIREKFDATQEGRKRNKPAFVKDIMDAQAQQQDLDKLQKLYDTAYDNSLTPLTPLKKTDLLHADQQPGYDLLSKSIAGTESTPFAEFLKEIEAIGWVVEGHNKYAGAYGDKCPYCQQKLPHDFEEKLASCFDETYNKAMTSLRSFYAFYRQGTETIRSILRGNNISQLPDSFDMQPYMDLMDYYDKVCESNLIEIESKIESPTKQIHIDNIDDIIIKVNDAIITANKRIDEINEVVNDRKGKKADCVSRVWQHMHYLLKDTIDQYKKDFQEQNEKIDLLNQDIEKNNDQQKTISDEISVLSSSISNVTDTIDGINLLLKESGFQGFRIRETKPKPASIIKADGTIDNRLLAPVDGFKTYEIERLDGSPAHGLSEGEKNFIAFLYFYHTVKGSESEESDLREKIVVIDDPVTSMDSGSMFIVSSLIREMIENCYTTYKVEGKDKLSYHIQQIFLMTHNAYFHKEITYNQTDAERFEAVTFFHVKKPKNDTSVLPCVKKDPNSETPAYPFNYNPVKNSYAALWDEYGEVTSAPAAINVIRRILEYYFVQLCGYDRYDFSDKILKEHKSDFIDNEGTPAEDDIRFTIASSMLQYLSSSSFSPNDDMYYMEDSWELVQCQEIFELIFEVMDQKQHFIAMTKRK